MREGGEAAQIKGPLRLYKLMRDVAETLKPSDLTAAHRQTDRQRDRQTTKHTTYSLSWKWRGVR